MPNIAAVPDNTKQAEWEREALAAAMEAARLLADRDLITGWAREQGYQLYTGYPGCKNPIYDVEADYNEDGSCEAIHVPRRWTGQGGPVLARVQADDAILDPDTPEARVLTDAQPLPPHFAIGSRKSRGEKHFLTRPGGVRRKINAQEGWGVEGLDILGNPDDKDIWAKIWDDCGYEIISEGGRPEIPEAVLETLTVPPGVTVLTPRPATARAPRAPVR